MLCAYRFDPTRRATHGSPVTWADRHGPYCFYLSNAGPGESAFPCWTKSGYQVIVKEGRRLSDDFVLCGSNLLLLDRNPAGMHNRQGARCAQEASLAGPVMT